MLGKTFICIDRVRSKCKRTGRFPCRIEIIALSFVPMMFTLAKEGYCLTRFRKELYVDPGV